MNKERKIIIPWKGGFKIHTANLLKEVVECAMPKTQGILFFPINQFRTKLVELSQIAQQINDPRLHRWCFEMTLYDEADPESKDYKPEIFKEILKAVEKLER